MKHFIAALLFLIVASPVWAEGEAGSNRRVHRTQAFTVTGAGNPNATGHGFTPGGINYQTINPRTNNQQALWYDHPVAPNGFLTITEFYCAHEPDASNATTFITVEVYIFIGPLDDGNDNIPTGFTLTLTSTLTGVTPYEFVRSTAPDFTAAIPAAPLGPSIGLVITAEDSGATTHRITCHVEYEN